MGQFVLFCGHFGLGELSAGPHKALSCACSMGVARTTAAPEPVNKFYSLHQLESFRDKLWSQPGCSFVLPCRDGRNEGSKHRRDQNMKARIYEAMGLEIHSSRIINFPKNR